MSIITATVENGVIRLPEGVELPDGTRVRIEPELEGVTANDADQSLPTLAERLEPFIGIGTDLPPDLALNHDHCLHGAPKQQPLKRLFADAFFFFALWSRDEFFHSRVSAFAREYRGTLVTTRWVLMEVADGRPGAQRATRPGPAVVQYLGASSHNVRIVGFSEALYLKGLSLYAARPDKAWSLTDCSSFVVLEQESLRAALTGDRHFAQAGFACGCSGRG